jgi:RES domain-containing protein
LPENLEKYVLSLIGFAKDKCKSIIQKDEILYRARINYKSKEHIALDPNEMDAPPPNLVGAGRINPEGISYLYCANQEKTAIAEIRPYVGSSVTIAEVKILKDIIVLDLTKSVPDEFQVFWTQLFCYAFTYPFRPDDKLNYLATQYFAEKFKGNGFEGIIWKSGQTAIGNNIAIFPKDKHVISSAKLIRIKSVEYNT